MATELLEPLRSELSQAVTALRLHMPAPTKGSTAASNAREAGRASKASQTKASDLKYSSAPPATNFLPNSMTSSPVFQVNGDLVMRVPEMSDLGVNAVQQRKKVYRTPPGEEGRAAPREGKLRHGPGKAEPSASNDVNGAFAKADAAAKLINTAGAGRTRDTGARPNGSPGRRRDDRYGAASLRLKEPDVGEGGGGGRGRGGNFGGEGRDTSPPEQRHGLPDHHAPYFNGIASGQPHQDRRLETFHHLSEINQGVVSSIKSRDARPAPVAISPRDPKLALIAFNRTGSLTDCRAATAALTDCRTASGTSYNGNIDQSSPEIMAPYPPLRNRAPSAGEHGGGSEGIGASSAARGLYETAPVSRTGARRLAGVAAASTRAGASMQ